MNLVDLELALSHGLIRFGRSDAGEHHDGGGHEPYCGDGGPVGRRIAATEAARNLERAVRCLPTGRAIAGRPRELRQYVGEVTHRGC